MKKGRFVKNRRIRLICYITKRDELTQSQGLLSQDHQRHLH